MEDFIQKINKYIEKNKNSRLNKTETDEVVSLLKTAICDNCDDKISANQTIEILLDLHYTVTSEFINNVFSDMSTQIKVEFIKAFVHSEKIVKNTNNFGINRSLVLINALLNIEGNDEFIHDILKTSSKKAYGKDGGQKAGELLSKICFESTKSKLLLLDYSQWDENELRNLSMWLDNAISHTKDEEIIANYYALIEKYNLPNSKKIVVQGMIAPKDKVITDTKIKIDINYSNNKKEHKEKIVLLVAELQAETDKVINEKIEISIELAEIKNKLEQVKKDKERLEIKIYEANNRNNQLQEQIKIKEVQICDTKKKMYEMDKRLEYAYKAEKRAENQELVSLKNDIVKELKLDYENYQKLASKESSQYHIYYEGLIGVIENIFNTLHRRGMIINMQGEE